MDPLSRQRMQRMQRDLDRFNPPVATGGSSGPGLQGPPGLAGDKGPDGNPGNPGADGNPGAAGDKGSTGDKGPDGDKGATGDKGPQGDPGVSGGGGGGAYDIVFFAPTGNVNYNIGGWKNNQEGSFAALDPLWPSSSNSNFTVTSNQITANFTGVVRAKANILLGIDITTNSQRPAPGVGFFLNDVFVGGEGASTYIRDGSNHGGSSAHPEALINVVPGDVISVKCRKHSSITAAVYGIAAYSQYSVERLS